MDSILSKIDLSGSILAKEAKTDVSSNNTLANSQSSAGVSPFATIKRGGSSVGDGEVQKGPRTIHPDEATRLLYAEADKARLEVDRLNEGFDKEYTSLQQNADDSTLGRSSLSEMRLANSLNNLCKNHVDSAAKLIRKLDMKCKPYLPSEPSKMSIGHITGIIVHLIEDSRIENSFGADDKTKVYEVPEDCIAIRDFWIEACGSGMTTSDPSGSLSSFAARRGSSGLFNSYAGQEKGPNDALVEDIYRFLKHNPLGEFSSTQVAQHFKLTDEEAAGILKNLSKEGIVFSRFVNRTEMYSTTAKDNSARRPAAATSAPRTPAKPANSLYVTGTPTAAQYSSYNAYNSTVAKKSSKGPIIAVIVILLLLGIGACAFFFGKDIIEFFAGLMD